MGGQVRDFLSQGSGQPNSTYEKGFFYPWVAMFANPGDDINAANYNDPATVTAYGIAGGGGDFANWFGRDDSGTFNVVDLVYAASSGVGGSPYESVTAYNPDTLISDISDALDLMLEAIDDFGQNTLQDAVDTAVLQVDTLIGTDYISDRVAAFRTRQDTAYLRDVSQLYAGLWEAGAIVGTQTFIAAALLKNESTRQVTDYETSLQVAQQGMRLQMLGQLISTAVSIAQAKMAARQSYAGSRMDHLRFTTTVKQDQQDKDLEYLTHDVTWDLDMMGYASNALGALYGAQIVPRTQTKGERLLAALNSSISIGIQGGMALGSPQGGLALGGVNFLTSLLTMPQ